MPYNNPDGSIVDNFGHQLIGTGLGDVPQTGIDMYDQLYNANPYRNLTYKKSFWQNIASALGFRTDADRWLEDAQVNASEYDASVASLMQQNVYNDPSAQASRERAAGLNPDLLGIGDVQGAAKPADDPNGMSQNVGDEFNQFADTVASVFSRAVTTYKDFLSLDQMRNVIDAGNIENARNFLGTLDDIIEGAFTSEDLVSYDDYVAANNRIAESIADDSSLAWEDSLPFQYGFNKRQRNQFYAVARQRLASMKTDERAYNAMKSRLAAMSGVQSEKLNPLFGTDAVNPNERSALDVLTSGVREAQREAMKYTALASKFRASLEEQEVQTLEEMSAGVSSARAQVTEYNSRKAVAQWNQSCARIKKDMLDKLDNLAAQGDTFAKALLYSWSLDDIAKISVGVNAGLNLSFGANFGFGFNKTHIFK